MILTALPIGYGQIGISARAKDCDCETAKSRARAGSGWFGWLEQAKMPVERLVDQQKQN
jgi:hypothetical protein